MGSYRRTPKKYDEADAFTLIIAQDLFNAVGQLSKRLRWM